MNINDAGIFGFDVSFYQDSNNTPQQIDFEQMKRYGASFVIVRCGQAGYPDPDFDYNWKKAKEAGLPRSSYWFGDKDLDGVTQARNYWAKIKNDVGEGFLFVDYEPGSWTDWNHLYDFLVELKKLSGLPSKRIGIYTGYPYWTSYSPANPEAKNWFKDFTLWLAWYIDDPQYVKIPAPWTETDLVFWQSGTPAIGHLAGVESEEIDYNVFNGDADKFSSIFNATPAPPQGEKMVLYYADLKANYKSNVRSSPSLNGSINSVLTGPVTVSIVSEKIVADGYNWFEISSPAVGYIALTTSYENFRPAAPVGAPVLLYTIEVYSNGSMVINGEPYPYPPTEGV